MIKNRIGPQCIDDYVLFSWANKSIGGKFGMTVHVRADLQNRKTPNDKARS